MPGFDIQYSVEIYKEVGQKYKPDLILWFESGYGFSRQNEYMTPIIRKCYEEKMNANKDSSKEDINFNFHIMCWDEAQKSVEKHFSKDEIIEKIELNYDQFFDLESTNNTLFFLYDDLSDDKQEIIKKWQEKYSTSKFLPIIPSMINEEKLKDGHPNKLGHETIAKNIYDYLNGEKIICD